MARRAMMLGYYVPTSLLFSVSKSLALPLSVAGGNIQFHAGCKSSARIVRFLSEHSITDA